MVDQRIPLAFSVQNNKKAYALLLGSGISRPAGIPTGWEVTLDLVRKVAALVKEECQPSPLDWYKKKFGTDANYSDLLEALAPSPMDRRGILRAYFEPNEVEQEQGIKQPTAAHKAIAWLVKGGYLNVVITTNFDRLLDQALSEENISPVVISSSAVIKAAAPLAQNPCTIIKVHGDYLDATLKNTVGELERYDDDLNEFLDRLFEEYGLIICGWSAEWDTALRAALERSTNNRYATYWAFRGKLTALAEKTAVIRRANRLEIVDADTFFIDLAANVESLERIGKQNPLSPKVAVATLKRYLSEERFTIQLHDFVNEEVSRVCDQISDTRFPVSGIDVTGAYLLERMQQYESITESLRALFSTGCYWSDQKFTDLWIKSLERVANRPLTGGDRRLIDMRLYPSLLLLYSGGISAIAHDNYSLLRALIERPKALRNGTVTEAYRFLYTFRVVEQDVQKTIPGWEKKYVPLSEYLLKQLRDQFADMLPDDREYEAAFDRFEYLRALLHADIEARNHPTTIGQQYWGPVGRFAWQVHTRPDCPVQWVDKEIEALGMQWPLIQVGAFAGSLERLKDVKTSFDKYVRALGWY